jgi:hypothetical protein
MAPERIAARWAQVYETVLGRAPTVVSFSHA